MPTEISGSTGVNKIQDNTIVNADINSSAAIAGSKLVMPTGSIVQVVSTHSTANMTTTSGSMVGTGLIATITPSSSSNKILVTIAGGRTDVGHAHQPRASLRSSINGASYTEILTNIEERTYTGTAYWGDAHALTYLYSPNTTNSVAIQPYFMTNTSTHYYNTSSCSIGLTLMEIAG
jgi:hypothetical protein